jgi:hypothetical protein
VGPAPRSLRPAVPFPGAGKRGTGGAASRSVLCRASQLRGARRPAGKRVHRVRSPDVPLSVLPGSALRSTPLPLLVQVTRDHELGDRTALGARGRGCPGSRGVGALGGAELAEAAGSLGQS